MKIQQNPDRITIDNSMTSALSASVILLVAGVVLVAFGLINPIYILSGIGGAMILLGVLFVLTAKSSHIELNKIGASTVNSKSLFKQGNTETFQLSNVSHVELDVRKSSSDNTSTSRSITIGIGTSSSNQSTLTSTIILATKTGQQITLGSGSQSLSIGGAVGVMIQDVPLKKQADQIASFIGVEVQSSGDIGLKQAVNKISQIGQKIFGGKNTEENSMPTAGVTPTQPPPVDQTPELPAADNNDNPTSPA